MPACTLYVILRIVWGNASKENFCLIEIQFVVDMTIPSLFLYKSNLASARFHNKFTTKFWEPNVSTKLDQLLWWQHIFQEKYQPCMEVSLSGVLNSLFLPTYCSARIDSLENSATVFCVIGSAKNPISSTDQVFHSIKLMMVDKFLRGPFCLVNLQCEIYLPSNACQKVLFTASLWLMLVSSFLFWKFHVKTFLQFAWQIKSFIMTN